MRGAPSDAVRTCGCGGGGVCCWGVRARWWGRAAAGEGLVWRAHCVQRRWASSGSGRPCVRVAVAGSGSSGVRERGRTGEQVKRRRAPYRFVDGDPHVACAMLPRATPLPRFAYMSAQRMTLTHWLCMHAVLEAQRGKERGIGSEVEGVTRSPVACLGHTTPGTTANDFPPLVASPGAVPAPHLQGAA